MPPPTNVTARTVITRAFKLTRWRFFRLRVCICNLSLCFYSPLRLLRFDRFSVADYFRRPVRIAPNCRAARIADNNLPVQSAKQPPQRDSPARPDGPILSKHAIHPAKCCPAPACGGDRSHITTPPSYRKPNRQAL